MASNKNNAAATPAATNTPAPAVAMAPLTPAQQVAALATAALTLAAQVAALPPGNVAAAPHGKGGSVPFGPCMPGTLYGVRVPHPANPAATLVLPWYLPASAAKAHPAGCMVLLQAPVWWLGRNGQPLQTHICPAQYAGMGVALQPAAKAPYAYSVRYFTAGLHVQGAATVPLPG